MCVCVYESESLRGQEEEGDNKAMTLYAVWQQSSAHIQAVSTCVCVSVWERGNICLHFQ